MSHFKDTQAYIVLSAELAGCSDARNSERTQGLRNCLDALPCDYVEARGCYKGASEVSFVVNISTLRERQGSTYYGGLRDVLALADEYGQESVLLVFYGQAALYYLSDDTCEALGKVRASTLTEEEAQDEHDAYTVVGGVVYVTP